MHSALRPYVTTGLAIVGSSVIALTPVAPPAPMAGAAVATKQVSEQVTLSARVVTINPTPDALNMGEQLQGTICGGSGGTPCYALEYAPIWTGPGYFGLGVEALRRELAGNPGEETTIFGFSEGAVVASQWLEKHLEDPEAYPAPENLTFIVIGNPGRKYGGSGTVWGQKWPTSPYRVIDVAQQYDPTVDMPTNTFNVLATLNATMGFFTNHLGKGYSDVDIDDPANSKWTEDGIEYVFVPAKTLPLVEPLRWLGLNDLADELTGPLQYLIEQGYNRDDRVTTPPLGRDKSIFYAPINLLETVANMPYYAVAGTNRFANAMRASGSWWVYTPTNVLGWDPANPEMTRAFVDFLVAIPSISTPLGETADWWARANLPMNAGCTGFPPCDDPQAILDQMFKVQLWDFYAPGGFTFTSPITPEYNPVSDVEAYWGQELGLTGDRVEWYGETVNPEPFGESKGFWDHLISRPEGIKTPTLQDQLEAFKNLADGLNTTWNPFVPKSYVWNPKMTPFAYLARPLAPLLCPQCNKVDPFMPADWKVGRDIYPGAYIPPSVKDLYDAETGKYIGPDVPGVTDVEDPEWEKKAGLDVLRGTQATEDSAEADDTTSGDEADDSTEDNTSLFSPLSAKAAVDSDAATTGNEAGEAQTGEEQTGEEQTATKPNVIEAAVKDLIDKFDKTPAEAPADGTAETPAAGDDTTGSDDSTGTDDEAATKPAKSGKPSKSSRQSTESASDKADKADATSDSKTDAKTDAKSESKTESKSESTSSAKDSNKSASGVGAGSKGSGGGSGSGGSDD